MSSAIVPLPPTARRDVGLGTAYERWAVYELLRRWLAQREVATALEGPIDGMAGIPGLHLVPAAERGARVTVLVPDQEGAEIVSGVYRLLGLASRLDVRVGVVWPKDETFDLVLTYNVLPSVPDWPAYLAEAARRARRHLFVSVTHPSSYGVYLRRALRLLQPGAHPPELFDHPATHPRHLLPELKRHGTVADAAYVDCPWWPDLFVETGQTLLSGTLSRLPFGQRFRRAPPSAAEEPSAAPVPFQYGPERFPFLGGPGFEEELEPALKRHPNLDGPRFPRLAGLLAHHCIRAVHRPA